ncbi:MAG: hypothetical protein K0U37_04390 [Gammaproteobacteria bacterium]|nr:hypothetical protein [Gammaproteobacteria bacterium]
MRRKKILIALLLVFVAPGILAVLFYMNPSWLGGLPTNKGLLIRPPVELSYLDAASEDKWHLTVWCPKGCDTSCLQSLDEMARVRLALGRRLYQVDLWLLEGEEGGRCDQHTVEALVKEDVKSRVLLAKEQATVPLLQDIPKVFLADPKKYLVLEYAMTGKAADVFQDLKRLLNTREQA